MIFLARSQSKKLYRTRLKAHGLAFWRLMIPKASRFWEVQLAGKRIFGSGKLDPNYQKAGRGS